MQKRPESRLGTEKLDKKYIGWRGSMQTTTRTSAMARAHPRCTLEARPVAVGRPNRYLLGSGSSKYLVWGTGSHCLAPSYCKLTDCDTMRHPFLATMETLCCSRLSVRGLRFEGASCVLSSSAPPYFEKVSYRHFIQNFHQYKELCR